MPRFAFPLLVRLATLVAMLGVLGCERDAGPPLVEVEEMSPREIEVGDRIELTGKGFPQGHVARVTFRGALRRPGQLPVDASVETEGTVTGHDRIEVVVSEALEQRFCGHGAHAAHTTVRGEVDVAFSSSTPGAPPLVGTLRGVTFDVTPSSVRASALEARAREGQRVLAFLGITPGAVSARGILVDQIAAASSAERAGIEVGSVIVAVDGVHVRELSDVAPASARSTEITVARVESAIEETKTVSLVGFAGERIPSEYAPALLLVGLALVVLFLLVLPAPSLASAIELRVARRLRVADARVAVTSLFGRGPGVILSVLASLLVGTFALGPHVVSADLDAAVLLVAAIALFLGSRTAGARGARGLIRAAADVGLLGAVLAAVVVGVVAHGGALRLAEIVRSQGGAPWEFEAATHPLSSALAFVYLAALFGLLRPREETELATHARLDEDRHHARLTTRGTLLERLGLLVAAALGVAIFFGGWQLPGGAEPRSWLLQSAGAIVFVVKTWALCGLLLAAASVASPWTTRQARAFVVRRLLPVMVVGAMVLVISRRLTPSASLETAFGITVVSAFALLVARFALRIRGAMARPEPHASPFL